MFSNMIVSLFLIRRQVMPAKYALLGIVVVCITALCFTWMVRSSLCELSIKQGNMEMKAQLAYEVRK